MAFKEGECCKYPGLCKGMEVCLDAAEVVKVVNDDKQSSGQGSFLEKLSGSVCEHPQAVQARQDALEYLNSKSRK